MTNSMLHWPLVWLSKSLFQHLRTYLIELGQTGPLCHFYKWAYESYLFFFTIFIANLNKSFPIQRDREPLRRSYFLIISGQRKKTIMSLLCTMLLKNTSNVFIETIKGTYSYHTSLEITSTLVLLAISLQHHSLHQVIIQQLCQYGSYHTMNSYFSLIIYCVITAYMLNHFQ